MPKLTKARRENLEKAWEITKELREKGERAKDIAEIMNRSEVWVYKVFEKLKDIK